MLVAVALAATAQPAPGALDDPEQVLRRWLDGTCLEDEAPALRAALRRHAPVLRPLLRRALDGGPPAAAVDAVRAAAAERHARQARFSFEGIEVTGVSREAVARLARTPQREFVADQVDRYVQGYRANAIAALAAIGGADDRARLRRLATTRGPLAPAARAALATADTQ